MAKLTEIIRAQMGLVIATWSTTQNGPSVDLRGAVGGYKSAMLVFQGQFGASATATLTIQESADNTNWSNVDGATFALTTANADEKVLVANVLTKGRLRYLRARITSPVNTVSGSALWLLSEARKAPATQAETIMFSV